MEARLSPELWGLVRLPVGCVGDVGGARARSCGVVGCGVVAGGCFRWSGEFAVVAEWADVLAFVIWYFI
jgi:hypothetical protein